MGDKIFFNQELSPQMYTIKEAPHRPKQKFYYKNHFAESIASLKQENEKAKLQINELNQSSEEVVQDIHSIVNKLSQDQVRLKTDYNAQQMRLDTLEERQSKLEEKQDKDMIQILQSVKELNNKIKELTERQDEEQNEITEQLLVIARLQEELAQLKRLFSEESVYI